MARLRVKLATATLLLVSLLTSAATASQIQGAAEWLVLTPVDEGFSVKFPVKPDEETDRVALMGSAYKSRLYTAVGTDRTLYMVVMQEFPSGSAVLTPAVRLEQFMDGFKEGLQKSIGSTDTKIELVPDRDLDLKGRAGRQFKLSFGEARGLVRAFDAMPRMYVLLVMGADEKDESVVRFFNSFEIRPAPAPVPQPLTETKAP
jgi:hypothetical protein